MRKKDKSKIIEEANKKLLGEDDNEHNEEVLQSLAMTIYMLDRVLDMAIESAREEGLTVADGLRQHGLDFEDELKRLRDSLNDIPNSETKTEVVGFYNELIEKVRNN